MKSRDVLNSSASEPRRGRRWARWAARLALCAAALCGPSRASRAQLPTTEEKIKILTDPESLKKDAKEKLRPPLEFYRSQVLPFDILPYLKTNHWSAIGLELQSNYNDYTGLLESEAVPLEGMPQAVIYRRDARLQKAKTQRLVLPMLLPRVPKSKVLNVELTRPDAIRYDESYQIRLLPLLPHQMLVMVLSRDGPDPYSRWNRLAAMVPGSVDRGDMTLIDKLRYYRLVLPLKPEKPLVPHHPLTWTSISHVLWDAMPPDVLDSGQQQAMLDWLHWGGQLVIVGGPGPSLSILRQSFLDPYLPADLSGDTAQLTSQDLAGLSRAYLPSGLGAVVEEIDQTGNPGDDESKLAAPVERLELDNRGVRYLASAPINVPAARPVFLSGLKARAGAVEIPLGDAGKHILGVERRVGRGRILMLGLNPTDSSLARWPGIDTFVRRVVLRRPEEVLLAERHDTRSGNFILSAYQILKAPDLSWVRYLSRDTIVQPLPEIYEQFDGARTRASSFSSSEDPNDVSEKNPYGIDVDTPRWLRPSRQPVAEWNDMTTLPKMCRELLDEASGITVPNSTFVIKVIAAFLISIVPLNYLLCRFVLGRKELAWVFVPILSIGFAVGVERAAAFDLGFDSACDEVDFVETQPDYPRAHVSRFAAVYSTGRVRYDIAFPDDPTALALPFSTARALKGEDVVTSSWETAPVPTLSGFLVQPRSLSMYRSEQMTSLSGTIACEGEGASRRLVNGTDMTLRDAVLVDCDTHSETYLGTVGPGEKVAIEAKGATPAEAAPDIPELDPTELWSLLRKAVEPRPENRGELRLVAWSPRPIGGQTITPEVDRHRGLTLVVAHLRFGSPPSPNALEYNQLALGAPEKPKFTTLPEDEPENNPRGAGLSSGRFGGTAPANKRAIRKPAAPTPPKIKRSPQR